jgi:hypothetical protein
MSLVCLLGQPVHRLLLALLSHMFWVIVSESKTRKSWIAQERHCARLCCIVRSVWLVSMSYNEWLHTWSTSVFSPCCRSMSWSEPFYAAHIGFCKKIDTFYSFSQCWSSEYTFVSPHWVQLVLRDKTQTSTRMVTVGRSLQPACLTYCRSRRASLLRLAIITIQVRTLILG